MRISRMQECTGYKKQQATTATDAAEERSEMTLKHQAEVEAEFHVEEGKVAEIKNQVQTAKKSPEALQHRAGRCVEGGG